MTRYGYFNCIRNLSAMHVSFEDIGNHIIPMEKFDLKWRFTEEQYGKLPDLHLQQLQPLDKDASKFLWDYIILTGLHQDVPFKKDFFHTIDKARITDLNEKDIKKWLYHRGLPFDKQVYLSWQPNTAMIVPWKLLIRYYNNFYFGTSDDLTVIDASLTWALLFYHEDEIYFGTNNDFKPDKGFKDVDFIW